MSVRLGEALIQRGIIDEDQLRRALDAQLIYGGHLGTCLVEHGVVDVDDLARVLGERFKINHADRQRLERIDARTIAALPRKLVERHGVVPFELQERVLRVAMVNPGNLLALDELSFASGYRIEAWIAPEILVVRALELYYRIPRKLRHIPVSHLPSRSACPQQPRPPVPSRRKVAEVREELVQLAEESARRTAAAIPAAPPPQPEPGPLFVAQTRSNVVPGPSPAGGGLSLDWMKHKAEGREAWCSLLDVPLDDTHFDGIWGVYVIWHHGHNPVLRVGRGPIRDELERERSDPELLELATSTTLYVTWAVVAPERVDGVERYLVDMLDPQVVQHTSTCAAIEVNLPR